MNVAQLILELSKLDGELPVYAKNGQDDGYCCNPGEPEWDEMCSVEPAMIQDYVWNGKKRVLKSINVVKLDVY